MVVLLDEIEKAHPDVSNVILQLWMTDASRMAKVGPWASKHGRHYDVKHRLPAAAEWHQ